MADIFTSAQKPGPPVLSHFSSHRSTRGRTNEATTNARSVAASCVDETPIALLDPVIKHPLPPQGLIEPLVDLADLDFVGCGKSTTLHPNPPSDDHVGPQNVTRPVKSPGNMRGANVKRWAAKTCTTSEWNGLRRDPELWFADGNCFVYLYGRGQSQRGPSFCVPFSTLRKKHCGGLFSLCFSQTTSLTEPRSERDCCSSKPKKRTVELYIPAPNECKEGALQWHITTRNFFAYIFKKPLVSNHLGQAFVSLEERVNLYCSGPADNHLGFLSYVESQGYRNFDCSDYALSMLYYAEHNKLRDMWIESFVSCVDRYKELGASSEFELISLKTKAYMTKSSLQKDIKMGRATANVRNFLEEDLSPAFLGLSTAGRAHLEKFRTALRVFYVDKFGYWPPPAGVTFSKALVQSLKYDFSNLFEYLVDRASSPSYASAKIATGGICVLQNVLSFDERHCFAGLPHPLPQLPEPATRKGPARKVSSQRMLRSLTLSSKTSKTNTDDSLSVQGALTAAANSRDTSIMNSRIVQMYKAFEYRSALSYREERVSIIEARKIRWLLIYGMLQWLVYAETPEYPSSSGQASLFDLPKPSPLEGSSEELDQLLDIKEDTKASIPPTFNIQPDCENDPYITHSRPMSIEVPAPLRVPSHMNRPSHLLQSLSARGSAMSSARSSRRNSLSRAAHSYYEALVPAYGNGLNKAIPENGTSAMFLDHSVDRLAQQPNSSSGVVSANLDSSWLIAGSSRQSIICDVPRIETDQPSLPVEHADYPYTTSSSGNSQATTFWSSDRSSTSSKSSTQSGHVTRKDRSAEMSGLLGGFVSVDADQFPAPEMTILISPKSDDGWDFSLDKTDVNTQSFLFFDEPSTCSNDMDDAIGIALSAQTPPYDVRDSAQNLRRSMSEKPIRPLPTKSRSMFSRRHSLKPKSVSLSRDKHDNSSTKGPHANGAAAPPPISQQYYADTDAATSEAIKAAKKGRRKSLPVFSKTNTTAGAATPPPIPQRNQTQINMEKVANEALKEKKKERRKSLWRR